MLICIAWCCFANEKLYNMIQAHTTSDGSQKHLLIPACIAFQAKYVLTRAAACFSDNTTQLPWLTQTVVSSTMRPLTFVSHAGQNGQVVVCCWRQPAHNRKCKQGRIKQFLLFLWQIVHSTVSCASLQSEHKTVQQAIILDILATVAAIHRAAHLRSLSALRKDFLSFSRSSCKWHIWRFLSCNCSRCCFLSSCSWCWWAFSSSSATFSFSLSSGLPFDPAVSGNPTYTAAACHTALHTTKFKGEGSMLLMIPAALV